ncbi:GrpB family protein [Deinococcus antarcticus]|uniref:GrpB family protein n=1 Tax=Deinococcus antarcticus TaxID=1298767 RepID=A0ABV8AA69_9DEIO
MTALSKPFGNDRTMPAQHELMPTGTPPTQEEMEAAFIGEMPKPTGKIEVREYAQQWPALYEREAARLRAVLGGKILALEHVGSTSVPGLAAKPIIDIDLTVENSADETAHTGLNSIPHIREKHPNVLCCAALQVHAVQTRIFSFSLRSEKEIGCAIYFSEWYYLLVGPTYSPWALKFVPLPDTFRVTCPAAGLPVFCPLGRTS